MLRVTRFMLPLDYEHKKEFWDRHGVKTVMDTWKSISSASEYLAKSQPIAALVFGSVFRLTWARGCSWGVGGDWRQ